MLALIAKMLSNGCMETLKISFENSKLKGIWHYSLPSGYTCPGASMCKTFCNVNTGKIVDKQTPDANGMTYRCYAATDEARYPSVRKSRWHNFDLLRGKTQEEMVEVITRSINASGVRRGGTLRVHIGGDYFSQNYFNAWMEAAASFPQIVFYSYTKSVHFLVNYIRTNGALPDNFVFTCSNGGKYDDQIPFSNVKKASVFFTQAEADALGLEVDHTDDFAISGSRDFALLLHGMQPKNTKAGEALKALKRNGFHGYSAK